MTIRRLHALWCDGTPIGQFIETGARQVRFEYTKDYEGSPISVSLPPAEQPKSEFAAVNFLDNLLPENPAPNLPT